MKNKYGYKVNINRPEIKNLYKRFKQWRGIPFWCPLSDNERIEFESYILNNQL